jgi:hypothetical protein
MFGEKIEKKIFLSHAWGNDSLGRDNHERCKELYNLLVNKGYSVWFDENDMKGNIDNSIIKGINNAKIILLCLTEKYCNKINSAVNNNLPNDNCYKEWSYSLFKQKLIIPIIMENNMKKIYTNTDGIIQMYLNNTLYIDLSENIKDNIFKIISTLDYYNIYPKTSPNITPNNSNNSLSNYFLQNISPKKKNTNITPNNSENSLSNYYLQNISPKKKSPNISPNNSEISLSNYLSNFSNDKLLHEINTKFGNKNKKQSFKIILRDNKNYTFKLFYKLIFNKFKNKKIKV